MVADVSNPRRPGVLPGREWMVSLVLALLLLVALSGLHVTLDRLLWYFEVGLFSLLVLAAAAAARALSRRGWVPSVVAAVVFVLAITVFFAPRRALLGVIPTPDTMKDFGRLLAAAGRSINEQSLPAAADTPILFLMCLGIGCIAWAMDVLALTARSPALAGLPALVLLAVPAFITIDSTDPVVFVLAAIAYLLLLRIGRPLRGLRSSLAVAAVALVATLVLPLVLPAVEPAEQGPGSGGFASGINPVLSLGQNLRQGDDRSVLTYSTRTGDSEYLRVTSVDDFRGNAWAPDPFELDRRNTVSSIPSPAGVSGSVKTRRETSYVTVGTLTSPWLPLPYPTASVTGLDGRWYWDRTDLTVRSTEVTAAGQQYTASSLLLQPSPEQLENAGTSVPGGFGRYLELPDRVPSIITSTADKVAGGASSNYEKALLLQQFFRDGDFSYSETAPVDQGYDGTGMQVIAKFLEAKQGYCIHFASAMAVMARSLGIPARIALGFLPGTRMATTANGRTTYDVSTHDLHAWPELYFEGIGWTRFEPTVTRGDVPSYADQSSADVPTPTNTPLPSDDTAPSTQATAPSATPTPTQSSAASSGVSAQQAALGPLPWVVVGVLGLILLLLVPAPVRLVQRSRRLARLRQGRASPRLAWREVLQTSEDLGERMPATSTPREIAEHLASRAPAQQPALDRLRRAVERQSFAAPGSVAGYRGVQADVVAIIGALRSAASPRARLRSVYAPASIWMRMLRLFGWMG